ncbi:hypothetical protein AJ81_05415 [Pseudothermotoga hypogea DSM 11164 = NBRC 106472]|uniref:Uncharacterized protein n=1 Tax=Pseudothermotoga hypogea DSM 11164 = NBRC 106472 TaxID=1123384 RepID=A0A0X1KU81_9THEM|nr:hypothetical protein [Pseudothermotoga hypogea]AJC74752.1 hypothetical protein AJ81_05415 [Pseudothermotoga hypogea DSM 11164 = NBRC 106472]
MKERTLFSLFVESIVSLFKDHCDVPRIYNDLHPSLWTQLKANVTSTYMVLSK